MISYSSSVIFFYVPMCLSEYVVVVISFFFCRPLKVIQVNELVLLPLCEHTLIRVNIFIIVSRSRALIMCEIRTNEICLLSYRILNSISISKTLTLYISVFLFLFFLFFFIDSHNDILFYSVHLYLPFLI